VIAAQVDFDRDVLVTHFFHDGQRIRFVGDVHAVTDAAGAGDIERIADVEGQVFRLHHAQRQLTRVQRQFHVGIARFEELVHAHMQLVVAHGDVGTLLSDDVDRRFSDATVPA
jgi:hypothetical protein